MRKCTFCGIELEWDNYFHANACSRTRIPPLPSPPPEKVKQEKKNPPPFGEDVFSTNLDEEGEIPLF